jgi:CubicO group peptidase (beta-lactamase class C family)
MVSWVQRTAVIGAVVLVSGVVAAPGGAAVNDVGAGPEAGSATDGATPGGPATGEAAAAGEGAAADGGGDAAVTAEEVAAVVDDFRRTSRVPGVAVAVTHGTGVVHADGYGRTADGAEVTGRTTMAVASVSKSFTALTVLQLAEEGALDLDDPVREHLPEFAPDDPRARDITVRQLLDQTSGLSDTGFAAFSGPQPETLRERVAQMRTAVPAAAPGERYEYHNPNYQVAARLVEVVRGEPFADVLAEHVFGPLGMADSGAADTADDLPPSARGHVRVAGIPLAAPEPPAFGGGSGGVLSTAEDMAAWLIAQNNGGAAADGARVLSEEGIAASHTPSDAGSYALGWDTGTTASGAPLVEHGGDLFTSTAYQALLPASGYGVAVMVNTASGPDAHALGALLVDLVDGADVPAPPSPWGGAAVDAALLVAAAGSAAAAGLGVRRAAGWARRRAGRPWWAAVRSLPLGAPAVLFGSVHLVMGALYRGRDVAWIQMAYLAPAFMLLLGVAALSGAAVLAARTAAVTRLRRTSRRTAEG